MNATQFEGSDFLNSFNTHTEDILEELDGVPVSIVLVPNQEEAYDIWLFKYNYKLECWLFSGIYQNGIFDKLTRLGYSKRYNINSTDFFFLQEKDNLIREVSTVQMRDSIKAYVETNQVTITTKKYSVTYPKRTEKLGWTNNSIFNEKTLQGLPTHEKPFLRDDANTCYVPFLNGIVSVTKDGIELNPYSILDNVCIWESQVIQRNFRLEALTTCQFADFIKNVANQEPERILSMETGEGYLIHSFNRPTENKAIICCDEELTEKTKPQGGTGKGIFATAAQQIRPYAYIDGKKFDPDSQFCFSAINRDTRIVHLDDVKTNFPFDRFFSVLSVGWTVEKKNQHAYTIPQREGPKLIICTNTAPNSEGSSNQRRQFILEFSPFYKNLLKSGQKSEPIKDTHGSEFFGDEWDTDEWERFDRYMIECVYKYMKHGLVPYKTHNVNSNRLIQTTSDEFYTWVTIYEEAGIQPDREYSRTTLLAEFRTFAGLGEKEMPSRRFSEWIKRYASSQGWTYKLGSSNKNPSFNLKSNR